MEKCPKCEVVMNEVRKEEIIIDVCPKCMGIWLDKGELDKIIERSNVYNKHHDDNDKYERDYNKHDSHYDHEKNRLHKRKGGFGEILGNLFD